MKRQRGVSQLLLVGALFIVAAVLWRDQLLHLRARAERARAESAQAARATGPIAAPIQWRPATEAEKKKGVAAVDGQLEAFRKGDYRKAVSYQSTALQQKFPSPEAFRQMMKLSYPDFADSRKVEYGPARADDRGLNLMLPVRVTGRGGYTVPATYYLVLEDGEYRVASVDGGARQPLEPEEIL